MIRSALGVLACASALLQASPALAAAEYKIVTASERGTYIQIGRDLANFVAPAADLQRAQNPLLAKFAGPNASGAFGAAVHVPSHPFASETLMNS